MKDLRQDRIEFDCFRQSNTVNQHLILSMFNGALNDFCFIGIWYLIANHPIIHDQIIIQYDDKDLIFNTLT